MASAKTMAADGTLTVTVAVKNTGSIAGKEIVQLYVCLLYTSLDVKMLIIRNGES